MRLGCGAVISRGPLRKFELRIDGVEQNPGCTEHQGRVEFMDGLKLFWKSAVRENESNKCSYTLTLNELIDIFHHPI